MTNDPHKDRVNALATLVRNFGRQYVVERGTRADPGYELERNVDNTLKVRLEEHDSERMFGIKYAVFPKDHLLPINVDISELTEPGKEFSGRFSSIQFLAGNVNLCCEDDQAQILYEGLVDRVLKIVMGYKLE